MPTMTMRLDETDAEVVRKYAEFEGKTISDFVRDAVFEKIEDQQDLATLREAVAAGSSPVEWCNRFVSFGVGYALSWSGGSSCWVGWGVSRDLVRMSRLR